MRIYLDVCCLNRPFDDQTQHRVRLESEAVLAILEKCQERTLTMLSSEVIDYEISRIPDQDRQQKVRSLASISRIYVMVDDAIVKRAAHLRAAFRTFDALHLAWAEKGQADVVLTTDDSLVRLAGNIKKRLLVQVENPLTWSIEEMIR